MSKKKNTENNTANAAENKEEVTLQKKLPDAAETVEEAVEETAEKTVEAAADTAEEAAEEAEETAEETAEEAAEAAEEAAQTAEETAEEAAQTADEDSSDKKKPKKELSPEKAKKKAESKARRSLRARAFKRGWFSIALVAIFIAGVIVVNMIAGKLVEKVPALVADTTGSGSFDLTDETIDYIKKLDQDIRLIVLCDEKTYREGGEYYIQADSLLHKYEDNASHISLEFMDLAENPTFTSMYPDEDLAQYGIIVQGKNDYRYLSTMDYFDVQMDYTSYSYYIAGSKVEEAVTSAILNVTLDDKPTVSFISGISDQDYSAFMTYLGNNGFDTNELSPAIDDITDETDILVLFAPNVDLDSAYVDKISAFLNNGGSYGKQLIYMPGSSLASMPNIDSLLEEWGLSVDNGYAVENDMTKISQITYGVYLFAAEQTDTTYTADMKNSSLPVCVFYGNGVYTHPINILDENKAKSLLKLSEESSVIYPAESDDNAEPTEEEKPSIAVGAIAEKGTTENDTDTEADEGATKSAASHVVVFGTNFIVTESFLSSNLYGNASYILTMFNSLVGRDNVGITVADQSLGSEPLDVTTAQLRILTLLYVILIPIAVLATGIIIFLRRRNR